MSEKTQKYNFEGLPSNVERATAGWAGVLTANKQWEMRRLNSEDEWEKIKADKTITKAFGPWMGVTRTVAAEKFIEERNKFLRA